MKFSLQNALWLYCRSYNPNVHLIGLAGTKLVMWQQQRPNSSKISFVVKMCLTLGALYFLCLEWLKCSIWLRPRTDPGEQYEFHRRGGVGGWIYLFWFIYLFLLTFYTANKQLGCPLVLVASPVSESPQCKYGGALRDATNGHLH